jgi:hypothetical protein
MEPRTPSSYAADETSLFLYQVRQSMVWEDGPKQGIAKGLRQVCLERFGGDRIQGLRQDGLVALLENEQDFRSLLIHISFLFIH